MTKALENYVALYKLEENFHERLLAMPISALGLGYAKLGDIKKAEQYRKQSEQLTEKSRSPQDATGRIIEQYIRHGYDDLAISILKDKRKGSRECHSAVQLYGYNKDIKNLKAVLSKTQCNTDNINPICHNLSQSEFGDIFSVLSKIYSNKNEDRITLEKEAVECLEHFARKKLREDQEVSYEIIKSLMPFDFLIEDSNDNVRKFLTNLYQRSDKIAAAEKEAEDIIDTNSKLKSYEDFTKHYAYTNNLKALEYNQKINSIHNEEIKHQSLAGNGNAPPTDYQRLYYALGNYERTPEMNFLLKMQIIDPEFKVQMLYRLLDPSIKEIAFEHPQTKEICQADKFNECVFKQLQIAYQAYLKTQSEEIKPRYKTDAPERVYLDALTLAGKYELAEEHAQKYGFKINNKLVAKERHDCNIYLEDLIKKIKANPIDVNQNYVEIITATDCIYTSGLYKTELPSARDAELSAWQLKIAETIPSRMIKSTSNVMQDIEIAYLNIPEELKVKIIDGAMLTARRTKEPRQIENGSKPIFQAIEKYLEEDGHYNFRLFNNLYHEYKNRGWADLANDLLVSNNRFRQEFEQKDVKNPQIKDMKLKQKISNMGHNIIQKVIKEEEFTPIYRIQLNVQKMNVK